MRFNNVPTNAICSFTGNLSDPSYTISGVQCVLNSTEILGIVIVMIFVTCSEDFIFLKDFSTVNQSQSIDCLGSMSRVKEGQFYCGQSLCFFYIIFSFLGTTSKSMVSPSSAEMVFLNQSPDFITDFSQSSEQKRKGFVKLFHGSLFIGVHCDVFCSR